MDSFVFYLLMGGAQQGAEGATNSPGWMNIVMIGAIIAIFYFLMIRPQNKKQKETKEMLAALKKGDKVVTIGGLHGTIQNVKENTVILRVDEGIKLEFNRGAIASVVAVAKEEKTESKDTEDADSGEDQ